MLVLLAGFVVIVVFVVIVGFVIVILIITVDCWVCCCYCLGIFVIVVCALLVIEPRTLHMLGKHPTPELHA